ncbi:hypothetical protein DSO57_1038801 [Entomophthora muscae]|uniref:Uncharacterized protein n=1 Tax=Entomophthora muscae TaxID=34485 RepID=A0ACC2S0P4_9FUNG|nr:hypothetical protein DSO57_1038801 [Entomophthora muscae]
MSCLTLQASANTRDSSYYTLPPNFKPSDDCVACPSYYDSPIPLCENVYFAACHLLHAAFNVNP